uniref:5-hydroxytryptamine receptor-like n=1 Tax=Phallusia mammillata TaxID=59560 RepID=A0A6F9DEB9_9ASCI|nr:5-hydroxytryptamine receptor-like [Phallusia mammillata]
MELNTTSAGQLPNTTTANPDTYAPIYALKILEVVYLSFITVIGTIGNLLVIFSIIYAKRVHKSGNLFIINLAVADLIVTGFYLPTVIANVIAGGNALPNAACQVAAYLITVSCVCSVSNLTCIAINRYLVIVHPCWYEAHYTKRKTFLAVLLVWIWSNFLTSPTLFGWSGLGYDPKMVGCAWDDQAAISYNATFMTLAVFAPLITICICYGRLYRCVRNRGRWIRSFAVSPSNVLRQAKERRSLQKEINLLKTLATALAFFILCWMPYAFSVTFDPKGIPHKSKQIVAWFGLSNSAVNFIVYGVMNTTYRKGYKNLLRLLCCCKKPTLSRLPSVFRHYNESRNNNEHASPHRANNSLPVGESNSNIHQYKGVS